MSHFTRKHLLLIPLLMLSLALSLVGCRASAGSRAQPQPTNGPGHWTPAQLSQVTNFMDKVESTPAQGACVAKLASNAFSYQDFQSYETLWNSGSMAGANPTQINIIDHLEQFAGQCISELNH